jgi:hypothetical protein
MKEAFEEYRNRFPMPKEYDGPVHPYVFDWFDL